jgi:integrase
VGTTAVSVRSTSRTRHGSWHSHATLALKAGVHPRVVQERLGHANVGITLDTYSHVSVPMQVEAANLVASLITSRIKRS